MRLEARGVAFGYPNSPVLQEADLSINTGELVALLGANGGGKTTLIRLLCGYLDSVAGGVFLDGVEISKISPRELAQSIFGLTLYAPAALEFTVKETVLLGRNARLPRLYAPTEVDLRQSAWAIRLLGLESFANRELGCLSNGERQKAMLAAALASGAELLLLDEPTSALDPARAAEVMKLLRSTLDSHGIIMATHDVNLAARFADKVALLADGKIFACGTPDEVFTPENLYRLYKVKVEIGFGSQGRMRIEFAG